MGDRLVPDSDELKERMLKYLNYMSSKGVTTLWDAGNFNMDDAVYQVAHDIAREGDLPVALGRVVPHMVAGSNRHCSGIPAPAGGKGTATANCSSTPSRSTTMACRIF